MITQTMIRTHKKVTNFLIVDKTGINDPNLSWKAKGLLCYLLGLPDDWKIYLSELQKHATDGRESTSNAIKELIANNYCTKERLRDERGRMTGILYNVYEIPYTVDEKPETPSQQEVEPKTEKPLVDKPNTDTPPLPSIESHKGLNGTKNPSINQVDSEETKKDGLMDVENKPKKFNNPNHEYTIPEIISLVGLDEYMGESPEIDSFFTEIVLIIHDVVNATTDKIKLGKDKTVSKSSFIEKLEDITGDHILYMKESIDNIGVTIKNPYAYNCTALYNAKTTYTSKINNHIKANFGY